MCKKGEDIFTKNAKITEEISPVFFIKKIDN